MKLTKPVVIVIKPFVIADLIGNDNSFSRQSF